MHTPDNLELATPALLTVLERARERGFLGRGPVADHVERSLAFVAAWDLTRSEPPTTVLDLGSGGGVPGLVLAVAWPESKVVLLDGSETRVALLDDAVAFLGLSDRVRPLAQRAEDAGRSALRGSYALVTARGFAPPAVTAECGAAMLEHEGILAVSGPPGGDPTRWPPDCLAELGLEPVGLITDPATVDVLRLVGPFPDRYPRRVGIPNKRPLWTYRREPR